MDDDTRTSGHTSLALIGVGFVVGLVGLVLVIYVDPVWLGVVVTAFAGTCLAVGVIALGVRLGLEERDVRRLEPARETAQEIGRL